MKLINTFEPYLGSEEINSVQKVIKSGWLTSGQVTSKFEKKIKEYLKCNNALAVNSCTSGINSALHAFGLKAGDEIITSPFTFVSVINNLYHLKLNIKLVDIDLNTYMFDIAKLKKTITKKTKCIIVTHYAGTPFDMEKVLDILKKNKISIIEDAATALGAKYKKKYVGDNNYGSVTIFSLYANKIITAGEGGIITCKNDKLAKKLRIINSCGIDRDPWLRKKNAMQYQYQVTAPGFKYNFTDIQSAIGIEQLKKIEKIIKYREILKKIYINELKTLIEDGILKLQKINSDQRSALYIFTVLLNKNKTDKNRDDLIKWLKYKNINTSVHYIPAHKHKFYKKIFKNFDLKNTDYIYDNIISLPMHNNLNKKDIKYISTEIKRFFKKK